MTLKIESPEVAELFFATRQLLLNSNYSTFLAPSLDRVRTALSRFDEKDARAIAMPGLTPEAAPVVEPAPVAVPAAPVEPAPTPAAKKARKPAAKKTAKARKPAAKKPVKKAAKKPAAKKAR